MRLVFCGTPDFAVPTLEKLIEAGHDVCLVLTRPDKPKGRSGALAPSPVKECALSHGIEVYQPANMRGDDTYEKLKNTGADAIIVAAYGVIIPKRVLELPKYGCINVHASLLPAYRGAAPIQWAVIDGLEETGTTIMQMGEGLDTGDIIAQEKITIEKDETGGSLFDRLAEQGAALLVKTLDNIDSIKRTPQPEKSTTDYARMIKKEDGLIDWSRPAKAIECQVRGMDPWPSAYTHVNGKTLKVWKAEVREDESDAPAGTVLKSDKELVVKAGTDALSLKEVQLEGKKRMKAEDFLRGYRISEGVSFI